MKLYKYMLFFLLLYILTFISFLITLLLGVSTVVEEDPKFFFLVSISSFFAAFLLSESNFFEEDIILGTIAVASYATFSLTLVNFSFLSNSFLTIISSFLFSSLGSFIKGRARRIRKC